ncbi:hypothetical protein EDC04DRAFT_2579067 [Pisolithus marmoratus]|nr:hypothetical protein EDC04DRAFT_2579067 [Pisolithus marmoratus]
MSLSTQYCRRGDLLVDILCSCDTVISGSTALYLLLPECGTSWTPTDLDIYVPQDNSTLIQNQLKVKGYSTITQHVVNHIGYTYSDVCCVFVISDGKRKIDLVVSRTLMALSPILQFHSTAVMNFISTDTIFCCYSHLTLQCLSMVNAGLLYYSAHKHSIIDGIRKYTQLGLLLHILQRLPWHQEHLQGQHMDSHQQCHDVVQLQ